MISIRRERTPVKPVYKAIYIGAPRPSIYITTIGSGPTCPKESEFQLQFKSLSMTSSLEIYSRWHV